MTSGKKSINDDEFCKSYHLSLTVGSGDEDDDEENDKMFDMRCRMQNFALAADDGGMPPTIFLDDTDFMHPSTSATVVPKNPTLMYSNQINNDTTVLPSASACNVNMDSFVKNFFATESLFQPTDEGHFIEEIFAEKPPKLVGNYLFGNVIGEGSYSKVKEVLHTKSLERRAVKIIKDKRLRKIPGGEQNVQCEIEVLKRIHHINVVELFEVFRIEEKLKLYIVMEFCVCSLQQMLDHCSEKKLPEFQTHLYFAQILDGLDYLHLQRIIHKDIKPGNSLLSLDGRIKICDLGVAEMLDGTDEDWCTTAQGTPKFQPPEVVSGIQKRFRGCLIDIWAIGVTLYNLVSGEYPFEGDVIMKLFENITSLPLEMPKTVELSSSLQVLLNGLLEKNTLLRWDSCKIRQCEWFLTKQPIINSKIVRVPKIRDVAAHRPLGVYHALEQLYEQDPSETSSGDAAAGGDSTVPQHEVNQTNDNNAKKGQHERKSSKMSCISGNDVVYCSSATNMKNYTTNDGGSDRCNITTDKTNNMRNVNNSSSNGGSKLSRFFRRKNLTNFLQKLIF